MNFQAHTRSFSLLTAWDFLQCATVQPRKVSSAEKKIDMMIIFPFWEGNWLLIFEQSYQQSLFPVWIVPVTSLSRPGITTDPLQERIISQETSQPSLHTLGFFPLQVIVFFSDVFTVLVMHRTISSATEPQKEEFSVFVDLLDGEKGSFPVLENRFWRWLVLPKKDDLQVFKTLCQRQFFALPTTSQLQKKCIIKKETNTSLRRSFSCSLFWKQFGGDAGPFCAAIVQTHLQKISLTAMGSFICTTPCSAFGHLLAARQTEWPQRGFTLALFQSDMLL